MKLSSVAVTHVMGDTQIMVSAEMIFFSGMVRSNETAAFIVDCLKGETTEERIVEAVLERYDAPRDAAERDVKKVLSTLRSIGLLDE